MFYFDSFSQEERGEETEGNITGRLSPTLIRFAPRIVNIVEIEMCFRKKLEKDLHFLTNKSVNKHDSISISSFC